MSTRIAAPPEKTPTEMPLTASGNFHVIVKIIASTKAAMPRTMSLVLPRNSFVDTIEVPFLERGIVKIVSLPQCGQGMVCPKIELIPTPL